jgi:hypothetical protein
VILGWASCSKPIEAALLAARQEREQQQAAAAAAMQQSFENCEVQFPEGTKKMIEKNKCNATAALAIRPFTTYTDLFDK